MSEKSELKPEVTPIYRDEMPGIVPPFSAKLRVGCMVFGEFIDIAGKSTTEPLRHLFSLSRAYGKEQTQHKARRNYLC